MLCRFRLQGAAARKYPAFSYRIPIMRPFSPLELLAVEMGPQTVDLADCEWKLGRVDKDTNLAPAELWLVPNENTFAKAPMLVNRRMVLNGNLHWKLYQDEMIREACR